MSSSAPQSLLWLPEDARIFACAKCGCELALQDELISKSFSGRDGPAFLLRSVFNVDVGKKEDRMLLTGLHTIAGLTCQGCDTVLGWTYLKAYEASQKYKEGRFIVEKGKVTKDNRW